MLGSLLVDYLIQFIHYPRGQGSERLNNLSKVTQLVYSAYVFLTQSPVLMFTFNKQPSGSAPLRQASLLAQLVKNPPAMWETWVRSLDWKDTLEKGKAIHSSILAWRIPWII